MDRGQNQSATREAGLLSTSPGSPGAYAASGGQPWESRLYPGLRMSRVGEDVRAELAGALGALGVEAEYFLLLLSSFPGKEKPDHARAAIFLSQLEAAARRLYHTADTLEIATQGYLTALESGYPAVSNQETETEPWWTNPPNFELSGETIELRMRRCGYAYRQVVEVYLSANITAIAGQLRVALHALSNLPPAGTLPVGSLHQGLYELSSMFQGYVIPHHIGDLDPRTPGLLTGISRLRQLDAVEDTSVQSDRLWAQNQLQSVQEFLGASNLSTAQRQWATTAAAEWRTILQALDSLRLGAG